MDTPLITSDGFPRSDIDVAQVRSVRNQIIRLKNDLKWLMQDIEKALHAHYSSLKLEDNRDTKIQQTIIHQHSTVYESHSIQSETTSESSSFINDVAFAIINSVADNSPAHVAGLQQGDLLIQFGDINAANHQRLTRLSSVVQQNEGRSIQVILKREESRITTELIPSQNWGGRGLLGCHIIPY